jgi:hypothetical protein
MGSYRSAASSAAAAAAAARPGPALASPADSMEATELLGLGSLPDLNGMLFGHLGLVSLWPALGAPGPGSSGGSSCSSGGTDATMGASGGWGAGWAAGGADSRREFISSLALADVQLIDSVCDQRRRRPGHAPPGLSLEVAPGSPPAAASPAASALEALEAGAGSPVSEDDWGLGLRGNRPLAALLSPAFQQLGQLGQLWEEQWEDSEEELQAQQQQQEQPEAAVGWTMAALQGWRHARQQPEQPQQHHHQLEQERVQGCRRQQQAQAGAPSAEQEAAQQEKHGRQQPLAWHEQHPVFDRQDTSEQSLQPEQQPEPALGPATAEAAGAGGPSQAQPHDLPAPKPQPQPQPQPALSVATEARPAGATGTAAVNALLTTRLLSSDPAALPFPSPDDMSELPLDSPSHCPEVPAGLELPVRAAAVRRLVDAYVAVQRLGPSSLAGLARLHVTPALGRLQLQAGPARGSGSGGPGPCSAGGGRTGGGALGGGLGRVLRAVRSGGRASKAGGAPDGPSSVVSQVWRLFERLEGGAGGGGPAGAGGPARAKPAGSLPAGSRLQGLGSCSHLRAAGCSGGGGRGGGGGDFLLGVASELATLATLADMAAAWQEVVAELQLRWASAELVRGGWRPAAAPPPGGEAHCAAAVSRAAVSFWYRAGAAGAAATLLLPPHPAAAAHPSLTPIAGLPPPAASKPSDVPLYLHLLLLNLCIANKHAKQPGRQATGAGAMYPSAGDGASSGSFTSQQGGGRAAGLVRDTTGLVRARQGALQPLPHLAHMALTGEDIWEPERQVGAAGAMPFCRGGPCQAELPAAARLHR